MRFIFIVLLISLGISFGSAYSQTIDTVTISADSFSLTRPDVDTILHSEFGYVRLDIDTLFISNRIFLDEYQKCISDYNYLQDKCEQALEAHEMIALIETEFDSLNKNLNLIEEAYQLSLNDNMNTINMLQQNNNNLQKSLENAKENLQQAESLIKHERWNTLGSKLLWGVGGTAVGILFGGYIIAVSN